MPPSEDKRSAGGEKNSLAAIAVRERRNYITPEDVSELLDGPTLPVKVMRDLLEIIGKRTDFGVEDAGLCAFIAWKGGREVGR
jgi:hypothetical protein